MFVWVALLITLEYTVHDKLIFLDSSITPPITQANVPYYTKISSSNAALADKGSFAWWIYTSDSWLIFPVLYVPAAFLMATILPLNIWITGLPIVLIIYIVIELFKSGYFTYYWFSGNCEKYPFCIKRTGPDLLPADPSFVWEAVITYLITLLAIVVLVLSICVFYSGRRERETLIESRKCFSCGEKLVVKPFDLDSARSQDDVVVGGPVGDSGVGRRSKKGITHRSLSPSQSNASTSVESTPGYVGSDRTPSPARLPLFRGAAQKKN